MKKIQILGLVILAAGIFTSVSGAEFSDEFAKNLVTCTEYSENASSITGMDKGKCVMNADFYTCRLSASQAKEISNAIMSSLKAVTCL